MGFASRGLPFPKRMGFASNVGPRCSKRPLSRDSSPRPRYSRDSLFQRVSPMRLSEWYSLQEIFILPNDNVGVGGLRLSSKTHLFRASSHDLSVRDPIRGLLPPILIHLCNVIRKLKTHLIQAQLRPWWILEFLRNKVPNFHFCPFLSERHCSYEVTQVISWGLQLYHLIGDGFIHSLHEKDFCLRTIQLSPSCRSPLPRVIRLWLSTHLQMLPSVPWREDSLSTGSACCYSWLVLI